MTAVAFLILSDKYPELRVMKFLKFTCSMQNLFYFIAGLILSRKDDFHIGRGIASIAAIVALVILIIKVILDSKGLFIPTVWRLAFCPLTLIAFWKLFPELKIAKNITSLAFPVFLIHYFFLIVLIKWNINTNSAFGFIECYVFMLCSSVCVSLFIRNFFPKKIVSLMFGGR